MHLTRLSHETILADSGRPAGAESHLVDILALTRIKGVGDEGVARILSQLTLEKGSLDDFFECSQRQLRERFQLRATAAVWVENHLQEAREEAAAIYRRMRQMNVAILAPDHPSYPEGLAEFFEGNPPLLYAHGNLELLAGKHVAVVNSAQPSRTALDFALGLARRLGEAGLTLLASTEGPSYNLVGLAGKQAAASLILVLHQGLFEILGKPDGHEPLPLARRLNHRPDLQKTLLISPFRPDGRWQKGNGLRRDKLLVALAESLVAVEIRSGGAMQGLCRKAQALGRRVFACPFLEPEIPACANAELIGQGATPLVGDRAGSNADLVVRASLPPAVFAADEDLERRRGLGQFFTPPEVADFMWDTAQLFRGPKLPKAVRIIEPACGECVFLRAARQRGAQWELFGVDLDETLLPIWRDDPLLKTAHIYRANGLLDNTSIGLKSGSFDIAIGNPPFSGTGLKDLLRLLDVPTEKNEPSQRGLFEETSGPLESADSDSLPLYKRAMLDQLARELSRYDCWRLRDQPDGNGEGAENQAQQASLFEGISFTSDRGLQGVDYDRMADALREWPPNELLDVRRPDVRNTIQRLASTAIEVYFVERFVQLAKPGGMIAVIVPESILASDQLGPFRTWLLEHVQLLAVVTLPQKVFTGVGANAKTGILFARRLTAAEQREMDKMPAKGLKARVLPKFKKAGVHMVSPDLDSPDWSLKGYVSAIVGRLKQLSGSNLLKGDIS